MLAARLIGEGAKVSAYDPMFDGGDHALFPGVRICADPLEALAGADAVVLVTEWAEFARLDWAEVKKTMRRSLVVDGRNFLDPDALTAAGFDYDGVGIGDVKSAIADDV